MPRARVGELELEYEVIGEGPPLLLVQGFAGQMIMWDDRMCEEFVRRGFQVIRYDHRDVGLSSRLEEAHVPDVRRTLLHAYTRGTAEAPYTLYDLADDGIGVLDHLGIERAHVFGASMGGMVVQCMAIRHPHRLLSATQIMSTTGARWATIPRVRALRAMLRAPAVDADEAADQLVHFFRTVRGPRFDFTEERLRQLGRRLFQRSNYPAGRLRHLAAIAATGDRTADLHNVQVPYLVLHGTHDPLVPVWAGLASHRAIPRSRLRLIQGLGHELPPGVWPMMTRTVRRHALSAET